MYTVKTNYSEIGGTNPCYVIAEIGSNHNGSFDLACEMMTKAKEAGVNAVKFQTFKAENHYSKKTPKIGMYEQNIFDLIKGLEIDRSWHTKLAKECEKLKIDFLDSPCDEEAIKLAQSVNMPLMKVASFDMVDSNLIRTIAKTKKAVMFSTGMSNLAEIQNAINICRQENNQHIIALQCTSLYPAPSKLSNLHAMKTMEMMFNIITGYSDHTMGDHIPLAAVAMGAKVIEKHYTLGRKMEGPDHPFAMEPDELKIMITKMREIEVAMGDGEKNGPRQEEMELYTKARRSLIAKRALKAGEKIQAGDVVIKRPGLGVHPAHMDLVVGRTVLKDIEEDEPITWDKL